VEAGALRELHEEACLRATSLRRAGTLFFHWQEQAQPWEVSVFSCTEWDGVEAETDEMRPQWFAEADVPYALMWQDDKHWWPMFLRNEPFVGAFYFRNTTELVTFDLQPL
jgi:hypothetical protein